MHPKIAQANRICNYLDADLRFLRRIMNSFDPLDLEDAELWNKFVRVIDYVDWKHNRTFRYLYDVLNAFTVQEIIEAYWGSEYWVKEIVANNMRQRFCSEFVAPLTDAFYQDFKIGYFLLALFEQQNMLSDEMLQWALNDSKIRHTRDQAETTIKRRADSK